MLDWLGLGKVVGTVASELIDTPLEKAQAQILKLKQLDPNGEMRRELARFASIAFGFYLLNATALAYMVAFNIGDAGGAEKALGFMGELFLPILGSWTAIVSASFGVNVSNNWRETKEIKGKEDKK